MPNIVESSRNSTGAGSIQRQAINTISVLPATAANTFAKWVPIAKAALDKIQLHIGKIVEICDQHDVVPGENYSISGDVCGSPVIVFFKTAAIEQNARIIPGSTYWQISSYTLDGKSGQPELTLCASEAPATHRFDNRFNLTPYKGIQTG